MEASAHREGSAWASRDPPHEHLSHFRRWQAEGCFDAIFEGSVLKLHQDNRLDLTVIHGDGTTTAAKKGGDNIDFSGHKKVKGDKAVVFCDRDCNVIAPLVAAAGNRNESPLLRQALPQLTKIAREQAQHAEHHGEAFEAPEISCADGGHCQRSSNAHPGNLGDTALMRPALE